MIKLRHIPLICISGAIWMIIGTALMTVGLRLMVGVADPNTMISTPILAYLRPHFGGKEQSAAALIVICLFIGFLKGRFVLRRSAERIVTRIRSLPNPTPLSTLYPWPYYLLIGVMILLGVGIRFFGVSDEIRAIVDISIGSALINGAMHYFRQAFATTCCKEVQK